MLAHAKIRRFAIRQVLAPSLLIRIIRLREFSHLTRRSLRHIQMIKVAHDIGQAAVALIMIQTSQITQLALEIIDATLGQLQLVDQVDVVAGALLIAADLLCLDAVGAVRFLAVALDLAPAAHQTREPIAARGRLVLRRIHHPPFLCLDGDSSGRVRGFAGSKLNPG